MDDMNSAISSVLSDPESMQQLKELAEMFKAEGIGTDGMVSDSTGSGDAGSDASGGQSADSGSGGGIDLDMLMKLMQAVSAAGNEDNDRRLLLALKPHVSVHRQEKIDRAVKLMKIYAVVNTLKDSGMLGNLDKLL